jgi:hypothetical protein
MLEHSIGRKESFKSLAPLHGHPGDKDTQAYQHGKDLSQVRHGWLQMLFEVPTNIPIMNSKDRTGRPRRGSENARIRRTSNAVRRTPAQRGSFGKIRLRAIADPRSSAKSVLMMAISAKTYRGYRMPQRQSMVYFDRL